MRHASPPALNMRLQDLCYLPKAFLPKIFAISLLIGWLDVEPKPLVPAPSSALRLLLLTIPSRISCPYQPQQHGKKGL